MDRFLLGMIIVAALVFIFSDVVRSFQLNQCVTIRAQPEELK